MSACGEEMTAAAQAVSERPEMRKRAYYRLLSAVLAGCFFALPAAAPAATFTVDSTSDAVDATPGNGTCSTAGNVCSLRAALQEANALSGADIVAVPAGTYQLTISGSGEDLAATGDLDITSPIAVQGASARLTTVSETTGDRTFQVVSGVAGASLSGMTISGANTAAFGAGVHNAGTLTIASTAIRGNTSTAAGGGGGGIANFPGGVLTVDRSEISGNTAVNGGGIFNSSASATVLNSTVSGNSSTLTSAGVRSANPGATLTVSYSTIAGNTSGSNGNGISFGNTAATPTVSSTIISNNANGNCTGGVTSGDNNVEGPGTPSCLTTPAANDVVGVDPLLSALANNGGPTDTRALQAGSSAIDNGGGSCPPTDQRAFVRPFGSACDSGSFEFGATPPDTTITSDPGALTSDPTPTFTFTSTLPGSTFECSIDAGIPSFEACSGAGTHTPSSPLADGAYTFRVRATDTAGNTDPSPDTRSFTVDTDPPETTITGGPTGPTTDSTPTFSFGSDEAGSTFLCRFDAAAFAPCSGPGATHTSPSGLAIGSHVFSVKATDPPGNEDPSPATRGFSVTSPIPNQPPIAEDDIYSVDPGKTLRVSAPGLLRNDRDQEDGRPVGVMVVGGTFKSSELTWDDDGSFTLTDGPGTPLGAEKEIIYRAIDSAGALSPRASATIVYEPPRIQAANRGGGSLEFYDIATQSFSSPNGFYIKARMELDGLGLVGLGGRIEGITQAYSSYKARKLCHLIYLDLKTAARIPTTLGPQLNYDPVGTNRRNGASYYMTLFDRVVTGVAPGVHVTYRYYGGVCYQNRKSVGWTPGNIGWPRLSWSGSPNPVVGVKIWIGAQVAGINPIVWAYDRKKVPLP